MPKIIFQPLMIANPQERLADLRISLTPSGLAFALRNREKTCCRNVL